MLEKKGYGHEIIKLPFQHFSKPNLIKRVMQLLKKVVQQYKLYQLKRQCTLYENNKLIIQTK